MSYLTPELIHPDFWSSRCRRPFYTSSEQVDPIGYAEIEFRKEWCARQIERLKNNPSNAVLTEMRKLIVDIPDAVKIRDAKGPVTVSKVIRENDRTTPAFKLRHRYPIGARFWVAEPMCCIIRGKDKYKREWFSADKTPDGCRRYTMDRPGSRVHFGEHRFEVEVVSHEIPPQAMEGCFSVYITFKKVELEL